mgnify:FL=1
MPMYTIEGVDRESKMITKVLLKAPTREEALLQARDRGVIPESLTSDAWDDADPSRAELRELLSEVKALRAQVIAGGRQRDRLLLKVADPEMMDAANFMVRIGLAVFFAMVAFKVAGSILTGIAEGVNDAKPTMRY